MKDNKHIDIDLDFLDDKPKSNQVNTSHVTESQANNNESKHINTNLEFLNEESKNNKSAPVENQGKKYNWIKIFWVTVGIIFVISLFSSDSGSSSSSYVPSTVPTTASQDSNSFMYNGETFSCSDYHYDKAIALRPDAVQSAQVDAESAALDARIRSRDLESSRIDNMYVDEYSQYSIDNFNAAVEAYNLKNERLQADIESWNLKNTSFNRQVDAYNNYLDANCRPQ
jgi:hypothetical protein